MIHHRFTNILLNLTLLNNFQIYPCFLEKFIEYILTNNATLFSEVFVTDQNLTRCYQCDKKVFWSYF